MDEWSLLRLCKKWFLSDRPFTASFAELYSFDMGRIIPKWSGCNLAIMHDPKNGDGYM